MDMANSRVAKFDKNGRSQNLGFRRNGQGHSNAAFRIAADAEGKVYVAIEGTSAQVFDNKRDIQDRVLNVGAPWAVCVFTRTSTRTFTAFELKWHGNMENGE